MGHAVLVKAAMMAALLARPAAAEMFGPDYQPCGNEPSTLATVECVTRKTKSWDQRLNVAYKKLAQRVGPEQQAALKAAESLWIQYRDANCKYYYSREGTIRQIQTAECIRAMTQDRAMELEQAQEFP